MNDAKAGASGRSTKYSIQPLESTRIRPVFLLPETLRVHSARDPARGTNRPLGHQHEEAILVEDGERHSGLQAETLTRAAWDHELTFRRQPGRVHVFR